MKSIKLFACLSIAVLSLQACIKTDVADATAAEVTTSTQTVEAAVDQNGKYTLTLPTTVSGYTISSDASHSSTSKVVVNNSIEAYEYVPTQDFVGTDVLVLTGVDTLSDGDHEGGGCGMGKGRGGHKGGNKGKVHVREQKVNVNITVTPATTIPS